VKRIRFVALCFPFCEAYSLRSVMFWLLVPFCEAYSLRSVMIWLLANEQNTCSWPYICHLNCFIICPL
jgi:hypothetical protein